MTISTENEITVNGRRFYGGSVGFERDGFVIDLYTTPPPDPRGSYVTVLPISSLSYRREHPTNAAFAVHGESILIADDCGQITVIAGDQEVLDQLSLECQQQELGELDLEEDVLQSVVGA